MKRTIYEVQMLDDSGRYWYRSAPTTEDAAKAVKAFEAHASACVANEWRLVRKDIEETVVIETAGAKETKETK